VSSAPKKSPRGEKQPELTAAGQQATGAQATGPLPINRFIIFFALALAGCAADLATKEYIFRWLGVARDFVDSEDPAILARWRGDESLPHLWWLADGHLGIQTSLNQGALFGMGAGWWWLFAGLSFVALTGILTWLFVFKAAHDRWLNVALGFVTGGILGNLYDRLGLWDSTGLADGYHHTVRDWILFRWPESGLAIFNPWPNFNIADSLLVTGAIMLVLHALIWREKADAPGAPDRGTALKKEPANKAS
jgi:signal peptidase II